MKFCKLCDLNLIFYEFAAFSNQTKLSQYGNSRLQRTPWLAEQAHPFRHTRGIFGHGIENGLPVAIQRTQVSSD